MKQNPPPDPFAQPPARRLKMTGVIIKRKGQIVHCSFFITPDSFWGFLNGPR